MTQAMAYVAQDEPAAIGRIDSTEIEDMAEAEDALEALCAWVDGDGNKADAERYGRIFAQALRAKREAMREAAE